MKSRPVGGKHASGDTRLGLTCYKECSASVCASGPGELVWGQLPAVWPSFGGRRARGPTWACRLGPAQGTVGWPCLAVLARLAIAQARPGLVLSAGGNFGSLFYSNKSSEYHPLPGLPLFLTQPSHTAFGDMCIHKTPQSPPQNTPFPRLNVEVGKMN